MRRSLPSFRVLLTLAAFVPVVVGAQGRLTSPEQYFGHRIGADYQLPNYTKLLGYFQTLARESDRMELDTIGRTEEGRPQVMAIISTPENLRNKVRYKEISARLSRAEGLSDDEARRLAKEGKAIVWIDGGLHATEVLGAQQLIETTWQLVSKTDEETLRFLNDAIILVAHANPDGMELVSDWYMREPDSLRRSTSGVPRLYEKYAGHDNNRDSYMNALAETRNVSRVMYMEWYPQIMYNHHQTGPAGTVMFAPPFRDPMNYNLHPLIITGLDLVGASLHGRMIAEKKGGTVMRSGASYSTWWNGGLRTTAYFHNQIGLLTESIGNPTPTTIPFVANRLLRSGDLPLPIEPQVWRFRQSIDYSVTANWAVLDIATRHREQFLYNIYAMGRDAIEAGNRDSWTIWPSKVAAMQAPAAGGGRGGAGGGGGGGGGRGGAGGANADAARAQFTAGLRRPEDRDPRAYVLSADQSDYGSVLRFVRTLQFTGIDVHRSTAPFTANGKQFPAGSFVVKTAQAFRPMVLDQFEAQDHPNDFRYPGAPPTPPYDNAGWTLAYQFGIDVERSLEPVNGAFEKLTALVEATPAVVATAAAGWLLDAGQNDAAIVANRLLKANAPVFRTTAPVTVGGKSYAAGAWYVPRSGATQPIIADAAKTLGVRTVAAAQPAGAARVRGLRVGVVDRFGGLMPAGWTRLVLETFEFPHTTVYPQELDAGNLNAKYDVLIFVDGAVGANVGNAGIGGGPNEESVPAEFRPWLGAISANKTIPAIKAFVEGGGKIVAIGGSTSLAQHLGLPFEDHLVENGRPLPREKYYIPGSLLEVAVDVGHPAAAGLSPRATVMFDMSPVLKLKAGATGVKTIATFDSATPLRSGWAWGQEALKGGIAIAEAPVGRGSVLLAGPELLFRAQPHGTFKFVFNALYGTR